MLLLKGAIWLFAQIESEASLRKMLLVPVIVKRGANVSPPCTLHLAQLLLGQPTTSTRVQPRVAERPPHVCGHDRVRRRPVSPEPFSVTAGWSDGNTSGLVY